MLIQNLPKLSRLIIASYILIVFWFALITYLGTETSMLNYGFALFYGLVFVFQGIYGLVTSFNTNYVNDTYKKAILALSIGSIMWGMGQTIWSYYTIVLNVEVPHPSWADASFVWSTPFWVSGLILFSRAINLGIALRSKLAIPTFFIITGLVVSIAYALLFVLSGDGSTPLDLIDISEGYILMFFNIIYPILDIIHLITILFVFALVIFGVNNNTRYIKPLAIYLIGVICAFMADMGIGFLSTLGEFYNGGIVDFIYATQVCFMALGISLLNRRS